ncbi:hypothetical protein TIFTF001_002030 [Ficus carica]|uniref:Uncharacterized protein n=1 Tax=Ficus carica TaxID=3494 RepID=A0AA88CNF4_FICCA|nr:hypothetical protein TIFTF001_002030 [Ficus carica]
MSPLEKDRRCGKEQNREVLQQISFGNPVSLDEVDLAFGKDYVIGFLVCSFVHNYDDVFAVFYLDMSLGIVLVPLELHLCVVSDDPCATAS